MHRRDLLAFLGVLPCGWSIEVSAQNADRMRRVGILMSLAAEDPQGRERDAVFRKAMEERGWTEGLNVTFDFRWTAGDPELPRKYAAELVALRPDVLVAGGGPVVGPLQQATRTIPIVFTLAIDPVARGYVASFARPGGNTTGFINLEYEFSLKWLELLTQIAPNVTRVAVFHDPGAIGLAQYQAIAARAPSLHVDVHPIVLTEPGQISHAIERFSEQSNGGLVVTASTAATFHRQLIIGLAARYRLPAVYPSRFHVVSGGLISYGPVFLEQYRQAADYVDRILNGADPANLPVQAPTRYEVAVNLGTARALGLTLPRIILARAQIIID